MNEVLINWKLSEVMARYRIKGADLAKRLDVSPNTVSRLKTAKTMPRIDGNKLNDLCNALNGLAENTKNREVRITPGMLLEYVRDEEETQHSSKLPKLQKKPKTKPKKVSKEEL